MYRKREINHSFSNRLKKQQIILFQMKKMYLTIISIARLQQKVSFYEMIALV